MEVPQIRFKEFKGEWKELSLGSIVEENLDPIAKPKEDYVRVGIYCHAKGTFQEFVPKEKGLDVDTMYVVHKDNLIVNITFAWEHAIAITKDIDEGKIVSHRFPTYAFNKGEIPNFYKYLILDKKFKYKLGIASPGGAGRNRVLNKKEFLKIRVNTTSDNEQKKIADFLSKIDERIKIQENIVQDIQNQKNGLMQKLFSREVRFKTDDNSDYPKWEKQLFSDVFTFLRNNTFSRDCLNYNEGEIKNIHYGDILTKFGSVIDITNTPIPFINKDVVINNVNDNILLNGDIVIADTAEDTTVGKSTEIYNIEDKKIVSGLHTIPCRPNIKFAPRFLGYYFNSEKFHRQLLPLIQGTKVSSINKTSISKTIIYIPCVEEQQKIANCLSIFDKKIEKEKSILEDWQQIKKGLLQQMFVW